MLNKSMNVNGIADLLKYRSWIHITTHILSDCNLSGMARIENLKTQLNSGVQISLMQKTCLAVGELSLGAGGHHSLGPHCHAEQHRTGNHRGVFSGTTGSS